ncbi:MAG: hypothetical protein ACTSR1_11275 [Candidatus Heimdallarchaeota archaeon]
MKAKIRALEGGSYLKGKLPTGCKLCRQGAQLFFLITGKCSIIAPYLKQSKD